MPAQVGVDAKAEGAAVMSTEGRQPSARGALGDRPLPRLLYQLLRKRVTGLLVLTDESGDTSTVYLREGMPVHIERPNDLDRLDRILAESGAVDPSVLEEGWHAVRATDARLGDWLVGSGVITRETLGDALKHQLRRKLVRLFFTQNGQFAVYLEAHTVGAGDDGALMRVDPRTVIYPGIRATYDEWRLGEELRAFSGRLFRLPPMPPGHAEAMGFPPGDPTIALLQATAVSLEDLPPANAKLVEAQAALLALLYIDAPTMVGNVGASERSAAPKAVSATAAYAAYVVPEAKGRAGARGTQTGVPQVAPAPHQTAPPGSWTTPRPQGEGVWPPPRGRAAADPAVPPHMPASVRSGLTPPPVVARAAAPASVRSAVTPPPVSHAAAAPAPVRPHAAPASSASRPSLSAPAWQGWGPGAGAGPVPISGALPAAPSAVRVSGGGSEDAPGPELEVELAVELEVGNASSLRSAAATTRGAARPSEPAALTEPPAIAAVPFSAPPRAERPHAPLPFAAGVAPGPYDVISAPTLSLVDSEPLPLVATPEPSEPAPAPAAHRPNAREGEAPVRRPSRFVTPVPVIARPGREAPPAPVSQAATPRPSAPSPPPVARRTGGILIGGPLGPEAEAELRARFRARLEQMEGASPFELLGLGEQASPDEVTTAYLKSLKQFHPDRLAGLGLRDLVPSAERFVARLGEAQAILVDPRRRAEYVASRLGQASPAGDPNAVLNAELSLHKGEVLLRKGDPASALAHFEDAVRNNPSEPTYRAYAAWARWESAGAGVDRSALAEEVLERLAEASAARPKFALASYWSGVVRKAVGDNAGAERAFRQALLLDKTLIEAERELRLIEMRRARAGAETSGRPATATLPGQGGLLDKIFKR